MLTIKNLNVSIDNRDILQGINLNINAGEVHVIMGPNGSGKSTLVNVLAGHPTYQVSIGEVRYLGEDLLDLTPEIRAYKGIFLSFQDPVAIPGVATINFIKSSVNAIRNAQGKTILDAIDFLSFIREKCSSLGFEEDLLYRGINEGFSGGEKKRNEILQLLALEPSLAMLDEIDSGLDIDALH